MNTSRRRFPWLAAALLAAVFAAAVPARSAERESAEAVVGLQAAEWASIRTVVGAQRKALIAGDGTKAFSYASPGIRDQFGNATVFLAMVKNAYAALLTARYAEFLEGAVVDGIVIQPLRLVAPDNTVRVALYTMEKQRDGRWKIAGCVLATSTVQAA